MSAASPQTPSRTANGSGHSTLVDELAARWTPILRPMSWPQRLDALNEIHDHLTEEFSTMEELCEIFPDFVAALIERLGGHDIECVEQAHIYANSIDPEHRVKAGTWLARNQGPGTRAATA
jgi:hypothetical protein